MGAHLVSDHIFTLMFLANQSNFYQEQLHVITVMTLLVRFLLKAFRDTCSNLLPYSPVKARIGPLVLFLPNDRCQ